MVISVGTVDSAGSVLSVVGIVKSDGSVHPVGSVQPDGNVKVMDFGIARAKNSVKSKTSAVLGTAHYISPEQAQGKDLSPASDIYSLGVVLYEAATGQLPFDGESPIRPFDGYVDALLGTGFRGRIESPLLSRMALAPYHDFHLGMAHMPPVVAGDLPRGINGKTGGAERP